MFAENCAGANYGELWNILKYNYKSVTLTGLSIGTAIYLNDSRCHKSFPEFLVCVYTLFFHFDDR
jgi:hypothetical protein